MNIYEPKGRALEYSPLALNFMKGCNHNCFYCYVPNMFKRFDKTYNHSNCKCPDEEILKKIETSAKKFYKCNKQILLSFTGDPYCNEATITREILNILNKYNHKVSVITKGGLNILKDIDVFKEFGDRIIIGQTLTFDNDIDSLKYESGAASPKDRINSLIELNKNGIKTWASFEPVIVPEQSLNLIEKVKFCNFIKIGKINGFKEIENSIDWNIFLNNVVNLCRKLKIDFYIKKDLQSYDKDLILNEKEKNEFLFYI